MDDYLAKPYRGADIHAVLARWLPQERRGLQGRVPEAGPLQEERGRAESVVIDPGAFAQIRQMAPAGAGQLIVQLIDAYLRGGEQLWQDYLVACDRGDAVAIAACCHALKSSSHNVGALHLAGVCREIEALCRTAAAAGAALEMSLQDAALRREWPRVVAALAAIREENA